MAAGEGDGLAVLGLFVEIGDEDHPEFAKLLPFLDQVTHGGEKVTITEEINPTHFLPKKDQSKRMWHYEGSLTTPPLLESVLWIVFKNSIKISEHQMKAMRNLRCNCKEDKNEIMMVDNFRPPVLLGSRVVKEM